MCACTANAVLTSPVNPTSNFLDALFPAAEQETHAEFKRRRAEGLRVSGRNLRAIMKAKVKKIYGPKAAGDFKASRWER